MLCLNPLNHTTHRKMTPWDTEVTLKDQICGGGKIRLQVERRLGVLKPKMRMIARAVRVHVAGTITADVPGIPHMTIAA